MAKAVDLTGQKFGRLKVLERQGTGRDGHSVWVCECECGETTTAQTNDLKSGKKKSCGCLRRQQSSKFHKIHGLKFTRLYYVWNRMKQRCNSPTSKDFPFYGGRGITVCKEWDEDFLAFKEWAEANGYDENAKRGECTLDRIDVNGNYEPSNCRWVSMKEQCNNRRPRKTKVG